MSLNELLEEGNRQIDNAVAIWVDGVAAGMSPLVGYEGDDVVAQHVSRLSGVLTGCTACPWFRDTFNEGSFSDNDWCGNRCPGTPFCEVVAWPVSHLLTAWQRAGEDGNPFGAGCEICPMFDVCERTETADTRRKTCLRMTQHYVDTYPPIKDEMAEKCRKKLEQVCRR